MEGRSTGWASKYLRKFGVGKHSMDNKINEEARFLIDVFDAYNGRAFNPETVLGLCITNITSQICFGERFEYDGHKLQRVIDSARASIGLTDVLFLFWFCLFFFVFLFFFFFCFVFVCLFVCFFFSELSMYCNIMNRTSHRFNENQPMHHRRNFLKEKYNENSLK